jgi:hypothetical protein
LVGQKDLQVAQLAVPEVLVGLAVGFEVWLQLFGAVCIFNWLSIGLLNSPSTTGIWFFNNWNLKFIGLQNRILQQLEFAVSTWLFPHVFQADTSRLLNESIPTFCTKNIF